MPNTPSDRAEKEKKRAAINSVLAAVLLTLLKVVVGLATNSLGILSEAAHSAFDLLAAGVTYWAVRYAAAPADSEHPYGHGKAENLAALVECLLLLITCIWVLYEAANRLFFEPVPVRASLWALGVMIVSIIVDYNRSHMLMRVAKKYNSQALEADALHFSTDMWSSAVVIAGLLGMYLASFLDPASSWRPWLEKSDALAAVGVCVIIIKVSVALGRQAVNVLLDAGDAAAMARIRPAITGLRGVLGVVSLRLRRSGSTLFVEAVLSVGGNLMLEEAHSISEEVERLIKKEEPHADVSVQLVPLRAQTQDRLALVRKLAVAHGFSIHAVEIVELEGAGNGQELQLLLELHVEMDPHMPLGAAHDSVSSFEQRLREEFPKASIVTHLEPQNTPHSPKPVSSKDAGRIEESIRTLLANYKEVSDCHNVFARSYGENIYVTFHCRMPADTTVAVTHATASALQVELHKALPELQRVTVHMEPLKP